MKTRIRFILLLTALLAIGSQASAEKPHLRVGVETLVSVMDPGRSGSNTDGVYTTTVFESLIARNHTQVEAVLQPGLATNWQYLDDTTLELRLREGVLFHNGQEMTADDAVFSIQRIVDADFAPYANIRNQHFQNIAGAEVIDRYTLRVSVHRADPLLELLLSTPQMSIIPKAYTEEIGFDAFAHQPVGTGPYQVVEFIPGERIVMTANTDTWAEPVNASGVTIRAIPELAGRVTALVNDEVDIIDDVAPDQVAVLENAGHKTVENVAPIFHVLYYNAASTDHPVMEDKLLRQALNLAIDRQLLIDALWNGQAVLPIGHQFPQFGDMYIEELGPEPHDPELARQLLEQSDYSGETIVYRAANNYYTNELLTAQVIKEMWEAIGVNVELAVDVPMDEREFMVRTWSNPMYFPDPAGTWGAMWNPGGYRVPSDWIPEAADYESVYETFRYSQDLDERRAAYIRLMDISRDEAPYSLLYQPIEHYGIRDGVNWQPLPGHEPYVLDFNAYNLSFD